MKNKINSCKKLLTRFAKDTSGATAIEYGLLVAVLSIALISSYKLIGDSNNSVWGDMTNSFDAAQ